MVFNDPSGLDAKKPSYTVGGPDDPLANLVIPTEGPDEVGGDGAGVGTGIGTGTGVGAGAGPGAATGSVGGAPAGKAPIDDDIVPFDPYADDPFDAWLLEHAPSDSTLETAQDIVVLGTLVAATLATGGAALGAATGIGFGSFAAGAISGALSGCSSSAEAASTRGETPTAEEAAVAIGGGALTGGLAGKLGQWAAQLGRASAGVKAPPTTTPSPNATPTTVTAMRRVGDALETIDDIQANPNLLKDLNPAGGYPLTAPAVRPWTIWRWTKKKTRTTGMERRREPAAKRPQSGSKPPTDCWRVTGKV